MRRIFSGALVAVAIATAMSSPAHAQNRAGPWQGAYLGVNAGYGWGSVSNNATKPNGMIGGVQGGYNWQNGQFVFGGETDLQISGADDTFAPWKFANPWFGTTRARAGFALRSVLLYGTAGLAYGTLRAQNTVTGVSESRTSVGLAAGIGMEVGLTGNWTAKAEYLYVNLSDRSYAVTTSNNGLEMNIMRFGVNYHF